MLKINSPLPTSLAVFAIAVVTLVATSCSNSKDLPKYVPDDSNTDLPGYLYEDQMRAEDNATKDN